VQGSACYLISQKTQQFPEDDPRFSLFLIEVRVYHTLPGPTLTRWEYQERIERYVKVDKRLIRKSLVPADPNAIDLADGVVREYQDLSARYTAEITTTVPTDIAWENDGEDFVYEGTIETRFPDQVTEDPVVIVAFAYSNEGTLAVSYGWDIKVEEGYAGPCRAVITERYTFDPTDAAFIAALPSPTQVFPKAETVWVSTAGLFNNGPRADVLSFVVPLTLHPELEITANVPGSPATWKPTVEATVPTQFSTGDSILKVSEPQRVGIGGLWVVRMIELFHP
jgi:hypothetical protein